MRTGVLASLAASVLWPAAGRAQEVSDPWPWAAEAPWHAVATWSAGSDQRERLRAVRGALIVGRLERARQLLAGFELTDSSLAPVAEALAAAVHAGLGQYDSAAHSYLAASRRAQGTARGVLAARAGSAWERAGRGAAAAERYLAAATDLPEIAGWLRLRAARAQSSRAGLGLLVPVPPAADALARRIRGSLLLATGDTAGAIEALAAGGARAHAGRLALATGDSGTARAILYAALAAADSSERAEARRLVTAAFPPVSGGEYLVAARAAAAAGAYDEAAALAARAAEDGDVEAVLLLGDWLVRAGRRAAALEAYGRAGAAGAVRRAQLLARMGRGPEARSALMDFVERHPTHGHAPRALDLAADLAGSDALRRELARRWPEDPWASRARLRLAAAALERRDTVEAVAWYREELRHGDERFARFMLGRIVSAAGDEPAGRAELTALARMDSLGYYGTMARRLTGLVGPSFDPPPTAQPAPEVAARMRELDLLDATGFAEEAGLLVEHLVEGSTWTPEQLLDLAEALATRGRAPEGIALGWRAARHLTLNHPRVVRAIFPWPERELIAAEAAKFGLDPYLLAGLIRQESSYKATARSRAGALGWMQLMPATGRWVARRLEIPWTERMFVVADANLHLGAAHLAALLRSFDGALVPALAAYNAGGTPVRRWMRSASAEDPVAFVERIPYVETRGYVKTVLRNQALYRALYGPRGEPPEAVRSSLDSPGNGRPE